MLQEFVAQYALRQRITLPLHASFDKAHEMWPDVTLAVVQKMRMSNSCDHVSELRRLNQGSVDNVDMQQARGEDPDAAAVRAVGCIMRKRLRPDQRSIASMIKAARQEGAHEVAKYSKASAAACPSACPSACPFCCSVALRHRACFEPTRSPLSGPPIDRCGSTSRTWRSCSK